MSCFFIHPLRTAYCAMLYKDKLYCLASLDKRSLWNHLYTHEQTTLWKTMLKLPYIHTTCNCASSPCWLYICCWVRRVITMSYGATITTSMVGSTNNISATFMSCFSFVVCLHYASFLSCSFYSQIRHLQLDTF